MNNTEATRENWNKMARAYEDFNTGDDSYSACIEWPTIKKMLPELRGKRVLDVGCGTGIFTFLLEQYNPKRLVGIDLSEEMLKIAEEKKEARNSIASFIAGDAAKTAKYIDEKFDFIFSSTTTHYITDLNEMFTALSAMLEKNGEMIFSIIHPVYSAQYPKAHGERFPEDEEWVVDYLNHSERAYIQPWIEYNDEIEDFLSKSIHYSMSDYMKAIRQAGLYVDMMEEPAPPTEWEHSMPGRYYSFVETPTYMILKLKKM